jgi:hypothetical protein
MSGQLEIEDHAGEVRVRERGQRLLARAHGLHLDVISARDELAHAVALDLVVLDEEHAADLLLHQRLGAGQGG